MEHNDLLEDVILAVLVASTTVGTLYIGWRAGRAALRRVDPARHAGDGDTDADGTVAERDGRREPFTAWRRRLVSEQARSVRHGAPATVIALRLGGTRGPLGRRVQEERRRTANLADGVARRSRASDVIRVTQDGIIRILLVETTEQAAYAYMDRISEALRTEGWTERGDVIAAWASMAPSRDLAAADRLALARLRGATSGWLRSLAVHRTDSGAPSAEGIEQEAGVEPSPEGSSG